MRATVEEILIQDYGLELKSPHLAHLLESQDLRHLGGVESIRLMVIPFGHIQYQDSLVCLGDTHVVVIPNSHFSDVVVLVGYVNDLGSLLGSIACFQSLYVQAIDDFIEVPTDWGSNTQIPVEFILDVLGCLGYLG